MLVSFTHINLAKCFADYLWTATVAGDWIYIDGGDVAYGGDPPLGNASFDRGI